MRFLADENFDNDILRGLRRDDSSFDVIRAQDTEVYQADDPTVLNWAADAGRMLLTHDVNTMPHYAEERVKAGLPMPGIVVIRQQVSTGKAIEALLLFVGASNAAEWENQVVYLPMR